MFFTLLYNCSLSGALWYLAGPEAWLDYVLGLEQQELLELAAPMFARATQMYISTVLLNDLP